MQRIVSRIGGWIDDRTGFLTAFSHFLSEDIPISAGWPQIFGSIALFVFLVQVLTGILLAFDYAPTVGDAYTSLAYIVRDVAGGRMIRGLHHWGASVMVIVVFVHMAQVFIYGAFKKPREATWIAGVFLLLLTLAFGLTGYLLPWDNRAYWGTMVTAKIIAGLPLAGPVLTDLIGATHGLGVVTFSRFYAFHTLVLPAVSAVLVFVHVCLVRRHGITARESNFSETQKFYPKQLFRDFCGVFIAFACLFLAAAFLDVPLESMADPTDTTYVPRPEWYFLFLFQLLKVFPGKFELIGTFVLPNLAIALLFVLPFLPGINARILNGRVQSVTAVVLVFCAWAGLTTAAGWPSARAVAGGRVRADDAEWARIPPEEIAGLGYFRASQCGSCHDLVIGTPKPGPTLGQGGLQYPREWILQHFTEQATSAGGRVSILNLQQKNALLVFVARLRPESVRVVEEMSSDFINGAQIFIGNACASCHKVNGVGGGIGPSLNGVAGRRSESWIRAHFDAPRQLSPGSIMPPYHFTEKDERALIDYLFSLPE